MALLLFAKETVTVWLSCYNMSAMYTKQGWQKQMCFCQLTRGVFLLSIRVLNLKDERPCLSCSNPL
jgi:hypothetical protein